jgi:hypothetical protein
MVGLAVYPRQIVRVLPSHPGKLVIKGRSSIHTDDEEDGWDGLEDGGVRTISQWIGENVPSLRETFSPAWWLPK